MLWKLVGVVWPGEGKLSGSLNTLWLSTSASWVLALLWSLLLRLGCHLYVLQSLEKETLWVGLSPHASRSLPFAVFLGAGAGAPLGESRSWLHTAVLFLPVLLLPIGLLCFVCFVWSRLAFCLSLSSGMGCHNTQLILVFYPLFRERVSRSQGAGS